MRVGRASALDADQSRFQFLGLCAGTPLSDLELPILSADPAPRSDDSSRAAGEGLAETAAGGVGTPLVDRIAVLANLDALVLGQGEQRCARDAGQDRAAKRWRRHRAVVEDEEDVHAAQFLDPALLDGIEEHHLVAPVAGFLWPSHTARGGDSPPPSPP